MKLSIVMPVVNEAAGIEAALKVLQIYRMRGVEIVVADGHSSDGTADLARGRADRVVSAPRGRALQMNAGAAEARGDVLLFLHADTHLPENADRLVLDGLAQSGRCWGRFDVAFDAGFALRLIAFAMNLRSRLTGIATGDQAIFVRREVFASLGGYPELPLMEDIVLSAALKRLARPACLRQVVVTDGRRWEKHGVLRTTLLMWWLRAAFFFGADPKQLALRYGYRPRAS